MGAMFAAVVRCPITSLVIIFEMTGNYSLILPLMAGNMLAWQIAKKLQPIGIYSSLLLQDGISLKNMPAYRGAKDYRKLPVQMIMTHEVFSLESRCDSRRILKKDRAGRIANFTPIRSWMRMENWLAFSQARAGGNPGGYPRRLCEGREIVSVTLDSSIRDAANRMIVRNLQQVPVVSQADDGKLLGWLTLNDIARQQNAAEG